MATIVPATTPDPTPAGADDSRRRKLLEAAFGVFARFGYRKTSMDELARAADLSRQGLYLHFSTKEELFRAVVVHTLQTSLQQAAASLADAARPLPERLTGAFDAWVGRYVGMFGPGTADLVDASKELVGPLMAQYDTQFVEALTRSVRASGLVAAYKAAGLTARQLAETLTATARGYKYSSATRADFVASIAVAVRMTCAPLREET